MTDTQFWQAIIQCLLGVVDAIERWRNISPRTCELRKLGKQRGKVDWNDYPAEADKAVFS